MGANITDYIREAHRCLHLDGLLHIWEHTAYLGDVGVFCAVLGKLGFKVMTPEAHGAFTFIEAFRTRRSRTPRHCCRSESTRGDRHLTQTLRALRLEGSYGSPRAMPMRSRREAAPRRARTRAT